ncbi:DNA-directed RNA polymerases II, IV and V subunit 12-like protein [Drosera capensis]
MDPQPEPVSYICGDCGQENPLKSGDVIQCRECGYRILYKKRTRRRQWSFVGVYRVVVTGELDPETIRQLYYDVPGNALMFCFLQFWLMQGKLSSMRPVEDKKEMTDRPPQQAADQSSSGVSVLVWNQAYSILYDI